MLRLFSFLILWPAALLADVPRVMTDIAPIHSLTAQVMGDLGTPDLLLPPGSDPHDFALRPSDAARLGQVDLLIWVGPGLTPWLTEPLATLAADAAQTVLLDTDGWDRLNVRDKHDHAEHAHDHGEIDPHAWLDPQVAGVWVAAISDSLSMADPANAAQYAQNAAATLKKFAVLEADIAQRLAQLADAAYILPHDGYHYFEVRFGLVATSALSGVDGRVPGPAYVAQLRDEMQREGVTCVFSDVEIGERWVNILIEGTDAKTARLDGIGAALTAGPMLYEQVLRNMAKAFETCLDDDI